MDKDDKFWSIFGGTIRKALNECPLTPEQAQKELDELHESEEDPLADEEIDASVEKVLSGHLEPEVSDADVGWAEPVDTSAVDEGVLVLNKNLGEPDPEVDNKVNKIREEALNEKDDDDKDASGLEDGKKTPRKGE